MRHLLQSNRRSTPRGPLRQRVLIGALAGLILIAANSSAHSRREVTIGVGGGILSHAGSTTEWTKTGATAEGFVEVPLSEWLRARVSATWIGLGARAEPFPNSYGRSIALFGERPADNELKMRGGSISAVIFDRPKDRMTSYVLVTGTVLDATRGGGSERAYLIGSGIGFRLPQRQSTMSVEVVFQLALFSNESMLFVPVRFVLVL